MTVQFVKVEVELPKELSEVGDALVAVLEDVVEKKSAATIASENFQLLLKAGDGVGEIAEEVKQKAVYDFAAIYAAKIAKVLLAKKA